MTRTLCLWDRWSGNHYLPVEKTSEDSALAGGGEGAPRGELDWELKGANKENSQQPPASALPLHQETSVKPGRLLESASLRKAQVNNWWQLTRSRTKLWGKPVHPISSGLGIFRRVRGMRVQRGLWAWLPVFHRGRGSGLFVFLPPAPPPPHSAAFSSLLKVASLWLLLRSPPLQSRPLPCPVRWGQLTNISALPGERLARLGTLRVRLLRAAAPAQPRAAKE